MSVSLTPALREGLGRMADALASDGAPTVAEVSGLVALLAAEEADWLESLAVRGELVASTPELEQALWAQSSAWTTTLAEQLPTEALAPAYRPGPWRALAWRACWRGVTAPPSPTPTRSSMSSRRPSTRSESRPRSLRPEGKTSCRPPLAQPPVLLSQVTTNKVTGTAPSPGSCGSPPTRSQRLILTVLDTATRRATRAQEPGSICRPSHARGPTCRMIGP